MLIIGEMLGSINKAKCNQYSSLYLVYSYLSYVMFMQVGLYHLHK